MINKHGYGPYITNIVNFGHIGDLKDQIIGKNNQCFSCGKTGMSDAYSRCFSCDTPIDHIRQCLKNWQCWIASWDDMDLADEDSVMGYRLSDTSVDGEGDVRGYIQLYNKFNNTNVTLEDVRSLL